VFAGLLLDGARFSGPKKTGSLRGDQRLTPSVLPPAAASRAPSHRFRIASEKRRKQTFTSPLGRCVPNAIGVVRLAALFAINDWSEAAELLFEKEVR
jgi:hypothetical protein